MDPFYLGLFGFALTLILILARLPLALVLFMVGLGACGWLMGSQMARFPACGMRFMAPSPTMPLPSSPVFTDGGICLARWFGAGLV